MLISCHVCHPSLANDNLSGIALALFLAKHLSSMKRRYSYRFLFHSGHHWLDHVVIAERSRDFPDQAWFGARVGGRRR